MVKGKVKLIIHYFSLIIVSPCALLCWLEKRVNSKAEEMFVFWSQCFSLLPGLPGMFLRRAFYCQTLDECSANIFIGFGSLFSHRQVRIADQVYIGSYCILGSVTIGHKTFIGSRVSVLSGKNQHERDSHGHWTAANLDKFVQINIAHDVWIGEGAILMADIGSSSLVAAGSLVNTTVPDNTVVAGNPARVIKEFTNNLVS